MSDNLKAVADAAAKMLGVDVEHLPLTLDITSAGKLADLGRGRSYAAAADGSMPTIKVAGRNKVPTIAWLKKLSGEEA